MIVEYLYFIGMFKKFIIFLTLVLTVFVPYTPILAQDYGVGDFSKASGYSTDTRDIYAIIDTVISAILGFIAILLFLLMLYAGVMWMTARGNDEKVQKAKDIIESAGIGLAIVLASYGITYFIFSRLTGGV